ncbi:dienelactone hydrolase family protein [Undibacterium sp. 5I1]|uniref:dienelactone hydrolase family protein n=1 Tax=unclassified Undibacterium TaxID=2630295 RepID=UPI002AB388A4|nr:MULTISPECIES: dienelactone hydrolase family protein [unclassified Undibacterium]MDY7540448.1 dienelactone hydrolase family protein [Undibacterium sp. 5I1]MEB0230091.1 dienelactone hydrolase family protein [Undibacterium sp. 10I3]MEB0257707.1 dienelactone hydrolase family protein [Undibacterium sp. 5I1]
MQNQQDFDSLVGKSKLSDGVDRRTFIQTAVGVGFAAAAMPVMAQTMIKTDTAGLTAGVVMVEVNGQKVPVYRAQPEGKTNLPVVLVISEIFGVHEHIADVARRFAKLGYLALAPELFVRQGDPSKYPNIGELIKEVVSKVPDAQVMTDLDAVVAWAKANGGNTSKLAITGFCWGGRITWMYSAHNPNVKAGAAWYGRLVGDSTPLSPTNPVDIAAGLKTPILGLYGAKDTGINVESIFKMETELKKGTSKSVFKVYTDSGHAFHADYRPSYVEADAKDGWMRCLTWFKENGVT